MKLEFVQYPYFVPITQYKNAIDRVVKKIKKLPGVLSIYQVGKIRTPGISDIDILVIFDEGVECHVNPLKGSSTSDHYLFSHGLYGTSIISFYKALQYPFFHNYHLLWGQKIYHNQDKIPENELLKLKIQTALEYLIKAYIDTSVELTYKIVKVRSLLLHTNALLYDLEYLGISSGDLYDLIQKIVVWRNHWFENKPERKLLKTWIKDFYLELTNFLEKFLKTKKLLLPESASLRITRNVTIFPSEKFGYRHKGIVLPPYFGKIGRRYFNIQHRFNYFYFYLPILSKKIPSILNDRFLILKEMKGHNEAKLPYFMPISSSSNIFNREM